MQVSSQETRKPPSIISELPVVIALLSLSRKRMLFTTSSTSAIKHRGDLMPTSNCTRKTST
ncbi:hypothetical protein Nmel_016452 [Mimus melanotis]